MENNTKAQGANKPGGNKAPQRKKVRRRKVSGWRIFTRVMLNIVKFVFVVFCVVLMVGGLVTVRVVEYVVSATANDEDLLDLESISLAQTSYIMAYDEDLDEWIEYQELVGDENRIWVNLAEIPDNLVNAVIAIEDREFMEHNGVSFRRTAYALANEVMELEDSTFGASTIDQQLIKNLTGDNVVTSEDGDETAGYLRKLREIFRAWGMNNNYSKEMIMEAYLNTMSLSERLAGVQAGARGYFDKDVSELSLAECATIAGITRAPTKYSPIQNPEESLKRRNSVLYQMFDCGYITEEEYEQTSSLPLGLNLPSAEEQHENTVFSYFSDKVFNDVVDDLLEAWNADGGDYTRSEIINHVYNKGLYIYSTVDLKTQAAFEEMYLNGYDEDGYFTNLTDGGVRYKDKLTVTVTHDQAGEPLEETFEALPQSAAAAVRYDGSLAAVVGGIGEKEYSLTLNRATDSARQVGSTMKPVAAYALGIDYGIYTYSSMVPDSPSIYNGSSGTQTASDGATNFNWPSNFSGRYRNSPMPIVSAIAESTNTVAVRVGMQVGLETMYDYLTQTVEISTLVGYYDEQGEINSPNDITPSSLIIGGMTYGISPYELAGAYTPFGGEETYGVFNSLHSYTKILDSKGSVVHKPYVASKQAVSEETGYIMNRLLWQVMNGSQSALPLGVLPTGRGTAPDTEMITVGKTGTTNNDVDRWLVGLNPYYVTAIWWGYDEQYPTGPYSTADLSRWGRMADNVPNKVFKALMEELLPEMEYKEFPNAPANVVEERYCSSTGLIAGSGCPGSYTGYYNANQSPDVCDGNHGSLDEEGEEGEGGGEAPPAEPPAE